MDIFQRRKVRRDLMKSFRALLAGAGAWLPMKLKVALAKKSTKLGYLLTHDGDFTVPGYLGSFRIQVNTKFTAERVMLTGRYEKDLFWTAKHYIAPGDVCLDIGANVGAAALILAQAVRSEGKVFCFEPGPVFCERLRQNLALNPQLSKFMEVYRLGLSDQAGTLHWHEDPDFPGNAFLSGVQGTAVEVTTVDDFFGQRLERLDFVKIDVEGMETEVLRGAEQTLRRLRPKIFLETLMDFEVYRQRPIRKEAADFLSDLGYQLFEVKKGGALTPIRYPDFPQNSLALPAGQS